MKILNELVDFQDMEILTEQDEKTQKKKFRIKAPMLVAEQKNRNNRVYPKQLIEREVNRYTEEKIKRGNAFGELDHPQSHTISLDRVALHIDELKMEGNVAVGVATILDNPNGDKLKSILDGGYSFGLSSRGLGSLDNKGHVKEDYQMLAVDAVGDPSAFSCWAEKITESKDYFIDENGQLVEITEDNENSIVKKADKDLVYFAIQEWIREIGREL